MEELKLKTEIGELIACFETTPISETENIVTGYFKNMKGIVVQESNLSQAIIELHKSLNYHIKYNEKN